MKRLSLTLMICLIFVLNFSGADKFKIDAEKNAFNHNNIGVNYLKEHYYYGAIKEFQMAIQLNPNTQATAVYYNNLGKTYLLIGYPNLAQSCFERAIIQNPISFDYYLNAVQTYKNLNILDSKLREYKSKKNNPLNEIMIGLIYIEKGQRATGVTMLDNFCYKEPDLLITKAVRNYMKNLPKK